MLDRTEVAGLL